MNAPDPFDPKVRRRNRAMLVVIAALFLGSLVVAGALRFSGWRPAGLKNHGELLDPPGDLRTLSPVLADGKRYAWQPIDRTWRIAVVAPRECGDDCMKLARDVDTVWQLFGKDADRVHVLWLCASTPCVYPERAPRPATLRLVQPSAELRGNLPRANAAGGSPVYVIDPNGFAILRYAPGSDPAGLRADLAKLLKLK
ncbi:hypothetical protein [Cognatilysobacter bugurensis]|uniref:Thioredoxin domain-containing protein n=1 Tax=Cognatilysobacter bugurensis TaxID=543356 RepID=A0A918SYK8_9GAMM|nr:hypothetical protein [Lysobacter bugurensis]GHA78380.1 hypothetical protein GCM10007067_14440 [Lysobacter bugurensis]